MPIEVRELLVKITVDESANKKPAFDEKELQDLKNKIVKECTEKVIKKLEHQSQR